MLSPKPVGVTPPARKVMTIPSCLGAVCPFACGVKKTKKPISPFGCLRFNLHSDAARLQKLGPANELAVRSPARKYFPRLFGSLRRNRHRQKREMAKLRRSVAGFGQTTAAST